jgi:outer membrane protein assembly factor BamA
VNPALYISLQNKFIPAMDYTFTYDNSSSRKVNNYSWLQVTLSSGGNITSLFYRAFGRSFNEKNKNLFGIPFAQFLKLNAEYRYNWKIDKNQSLVSRIAGGIIYSYGNSTVAPYSEQFYVGGANSIRAFTVRSIGPGGFHEDDARSKYSYVEQTGDLKFEANTEYRFRIIGDIHGAFFLDAGNVWLIRNDSYRPDAQFRLNTFAKQIALGTGFGIRYDIDYLVFRLDAGIALHDPYNTERSGYYNISSFRKGIGIHFAIGYPF